MNPCYNGIQKYLPMPIILGRLTSLNPCSNGIQKYNLEINKLKNYYFKSLTNISK